MSTLPKKKKDDKIKTSLLLLLSFIVGSITVTILGMEKYALGFSWVLLATCPGVLGPTIASVIEGKSTMEPFLSYKLFCGALYIGSAIMTATVRWRINKKFFVKIYVYEISPLFYTFMIDNAAIFFFGKGALKLVY